ELPLRRPDQGGQRRAHRLLQEPEQPRGRHHQGGAGRERHLESVVTRRRRRSRLPGPAGGGSRSGGIVTFTALRSVAVERRCVCARPPAATRRRARWPHARSRSGPAAVGGTWERGGGGGGGGSGRRSGRRARGTAGRAPEI